MNPIARAALLLFACLPLQGCAALQAIGPLTSAYGAWKSHQAAEAVQNSVHCDALPDMVLHERTIDAAPRSDLEMILGYQRVREAKCGQ